MSLLDALGGGPMADVDAKPDCSRAGCHAAATSRIDWRNPKIHTGERFKTWLACDEHLPFLREFLGARSFPLAVHSLDGGESGVERPGAIASTDARPAARAEAGA